ncbi:MAG TPA: hypothetical protein VK357_09085 [Rubrobacteraceae bacterium]|jgi:hypothetical protein|nr:hypothetical protein [Rubrobacteraceae bacterium]
MITITGIVGFVWNLYGTFWWYDLVQHGGFVFALALTMALHTYRVTQNNTSKLLCF